MITKGGKYLSDMSDILPRVGCCASLGILLGDEGAEQKAETSLSWTVTGLFNCPTLNVLALLLCGEADSE